MKYDVVIIGGGIAGLSLSIDLKKRGYSIVVIDKGTYPRHKVCGEYFSMESHAYLHRLCPELNSYNLPIMNNFILSSGKQQFQTKLDLGGFGISRYLLEELLYTEAKKNGVVFMLKCKAYDISFDESDNIYSVKTNSENVSARLVCNASGRKSNFESKVKDDHFTSTSYVGIKYHVNLERDSSHVEIHNFPGGYCGVSSIEHDKVCICYIVNSKKLNNVSNSIADMESKYLHQNSILKKIFSEAEFLFKQPLTISNINFKIKESASNEQIFLGDSAGSIAPVTGNGMSIALRSAAELSSIIDRYFNKEINRKQLTDNYGNFWNKEFSKRVKLSRHFQKLSEYPLLTNLSISLFKPFPFLAEKIIKYTHGTKF